MSVSTLIDPYRLGQPSTASAPLMQLNPSFEPGGWIEELVSDGTLDAKCAKIFRLKNKDDAFGKPCPVPINHPLRFDCSSGMVNSRWHGCRNISGISA